jgi:hypothetical protein
MAGYCSEADGVRVSLTSANRENAKLTAPPDSGLEIPFAPANTEPGVRPREHSAIAQLLIPREATELQRNKFVSRILGRARTEPHGASSPKTSSLTGQPRRSAPTISPTIIPTPCRDASSSTRFRRATKSTLILRLQERAAIHTPVSLHDDGRAPLPGTCGNTRSAAVTISGRAHVPPVSRRPCRAVTSTT